MTVGEDRQVDAMVLYTASKARPNQDYLHLTLTPFGMTMTQTVYGVQNGTA